VVVGIGVLVVLAVGVGESVGSNNCRDPQPDTETLTVNKLAIKIQTTVVCRFDSMRSSGPKLRRKRRAWSACLLRPLPAFSTATKANC
jgi:hypothetical protein